MNFSPFSCPIFLGHREARGRCSQGERVLYGRDLCPSGGTGKAEAAKPPGAGIGPKQCPGKCAGEKGHLPESVRINDEQTGNEHEVDVADYAARFDGWPGWFLKRIWVPRPRFLRAGLFLRPLPISLGYRFTKSISRR